MFGQIVRTRCVGPSDSTYFAHVGQIRCMTALNVGSIGLLLAACLVQIALSNELKYGRLDVSIRGASLHSPPPSWRFLASLRCGRSGLSCVSLDAEAPRSTQMSAYFLGFGTATRRACRIAARRTPVSCGDGRSRLRFGPCRHRVGLITGVPRARAERQHRAYPHALARAQTRTRARARMRTRRADGACATVRPADRAARPPPQRAKDDEDDGELGAAGDRRRPR